MTLKPRKYRNQPVEIDGIWFASKREARRWGELQLLQRCGRIADLRRQVKFPLAVNGVHICDYVADAVYREGDAEVVEDAKGARTKEYILKAKLMRAVHGVVVREV